MFEAARDFLNTVYQAPPPNVSDKPLVTLTYAQSLDGKISRQGEQLLLSGKESMAMTHRLRTLHDGIMVGIGTVLTDNPQLNARLLDEPVSVEKQPQPIVLDTRLRIPLNCKLLTNYQQGTGKQPWVVTSSTDTKAVEKAGARIISVETISLEHVMQALYAQGIRRLMVEGGSHVIQSFLREHHLVHHLIVTIAPTLVGPGVMATGDGYWGNKED
ncbi:dihydrofolate reductase-like domain-containing protein [Syncephalastrum racemosum]|uniref:2,5-diamino-6-ribosylamino-4(3H)-pyrimidinone 5'-phosphate reductase n=1 Tax=Syncephalastrum racemosum TaxID=13706 RepID=A0A1X2GZU2_SYNRA|nr:dihydrofolate reductase-like domain-containing protein [Syncephalastrum racemosum]